VNKTYSRLLRNDLLREPQHDNVLPSKGLNTSSLSNPQTTSKAGNSQKSLIIGSQGFFQGIAQKANSMKVKQAQATGGIVSPRRKSPRKAKQDAGVTPKDSLGAGAKDVAAVVEKGVKDDSKTVEVIETTVKAIEHMVVGKSAGDEGTKGGTFTGAQEAAENPVLSPRRKSPRNSPRKSPKKQDTSSVERIAIIGITSPRRSPGNTTATSAEAAQTNSTGIFQPELVPLRDVDCVILKEQQEVLDLLPPSIA
jgi:hypothetical protein